MRLLLINSNPAVSRLIHLSAEKLGYEIEEFANDVIDLNKDFDVTITDSDSVQESSFLLLKETGNLGKIIYIGPRGTDKPEFADYFLQKPFLPTDFVDLVKKINKNEEEILDEPRDEILERNHEQEEELALDLDTLDSLDIPMPEDDMPLKFGKNEENEEMTTDDLMEDNNKDANIEELFGVNTKPEDYDEEEKLTLSDEQDNKSSEEFSTSILDSEDIDEVKQLLNYKEDNIDEVEDIEEKEDEEDTVVEDDLDMSEFKMEEETLQEKEEESPEVKDNEEAEAYDTQKSDEKAFVEDFKEEDIEDIEEKNDEEDTVVEDDLDMSEFKMEEETSQEKEEESPEVKDNEEAEAYDTQKSDENLESEEVEKNAGDWVEVSEEPEIYDTSKNSEKTHLEDLKEEDFEGIFGENISNVNMENSEKIIVEDIKDELQKTIINDVKKVLDKNEIKEALKDLKINISISFDEV